MSEINKEQKHALEKIAIRIAESKTVKLKFHGQIDKVSGDRIQIRDEAKYDLALAQGLTAHEAGHIGYGSLSPIIHNLVDILNKEKKIPRDVAIELINIVEDARINKINRRVFPGFYRNLMDLFETEIYPRIKAQYPILPLTTSIGLFLEEIEEDIPAYHQLSKRQQRILKKARQVQNKYLSPTTTVFLTNLLAELFKTDAPEGDGGEGEGEGEGENNKDKQQQQGQGVAQMMAAMMSDAQQGKGQEGQPQGVPDSRFKYEPNASMARQIGTDAASQHRERPQDAPTDQDELTETMMSNIWNATPEELQDLADKMTKPQQYGQSWWQQQQEEQEAKQQPGRTSNAIADIMEDAMKRGDKEMYNKIVRMIMEPHRDPDRPVTEIRNYENLQRMKPTYREIMSEFDIVIKRLRKILWLYQKKPLTQQKSGRLNNNMMKAVLSDYRRPFTRKIYEKVPKLTLLIDISGSMKARASEVGRGERNKLSWAKIAAVVLGEVLKEIVKLRIVLFTGIQNVAHHIIKDFDDDVTEADYERFGYDNRFGENLDGVSVLYEADKIGRDGIIIVVSDGQPAGSSYSLGDAIPQTRRARDICKLIFAFSLLANGDHLKKMYGENYMIVESEEHFHQKFFEFAQTLMRLYFKKL